LAAGDQTPPKLEPQTQVHLNHATEKIRDADCCRRQRNNAFRSRSIEMKIAMQTDLGAIPDFMGIDVRFPGIDGGRSGLFM